MNSEKISLMDTEIYADLNRVRRLSSAIKRKRAAIARFRLINTACT